MLSEALKTRSTDAWMSLFRSMKIPAGPIMNTKEVVEDEYIKGASVSLTSDGDTFNWLKYPTLHSTFEATITKPTTLPGTHTRDILMELLSLSEDECERLSESNVIND
jgi:crotonobetainyl-CoA:carnitine CoA-transferase CaiB-like acyl-CoA transferase